MLSPHGDAGDLKGRGHLEKFGQWDYTGLESEAIRRQLDRGH